MAGKSTVRRMAVGAFVALGAAGAARVAAEPLPEPCLAVPVPAAAPAPRSMSRLGLAGVRYVDPQTRMSEAGLAWSLSDRLTLRLSYERTAFAPLMARDHDDGILTGIKLGF